MNINDEELLNELFAHRIQFMDYSTDEYYIIRRLKMKLIEMGYAQENINNIIYSFYNHFNILITLSEIENIHIHNNQTLYVGPTLFQNLISSIINQPTILEEVEPDEENNQNQDNQNNDDDMPPLAEAPQINYNPLDNQFNIGNILNILLGASPSAGTNIMFEQILIQPLQVTQGQNQPRTFMEDVLVTTDENTLNTMNVLKITKDMNEKCAICMDEMNEDEEYFDIKCKHIFHKGCLEIYLTNYNHICPVCRNEIGESNPHLN